MGKTIFERYNFQSVDADDKYKPLLEAIDANYNMNLKGTYKCESVLGIFLHVCLSISIPSKGVYGDLDVRADEEIMMYAKEDYPFSVPAVLFVRDDFPTERIPHLNSGVSGSPIELLNPCLYRGDINEWFFQNGPYTFCDRVNGWFSDLVNGNLMKGDGFETVRMENPYGIVELNQYFLYRRIVEYSRDYGSEIFSVQITRTNYFKVLDREYSSNEREDVWPCIFVFDREKIVDKYVSKSHVIESDLCCYPAEKRIAHGIRKIKNRSYQEKNKKTMVSVLIIIAVKRPMQVIGAFSEYEFMAFLMPYDFRVEPVLQNCQVREMEVIQSLSKEMSVRLSGTEDNLFQPVVILGCGALGSKISMHLFRMGYSEQHLYDDDVLLPHNLVRHYENNNIAVGQYKTDVLKMEMNCMYGNESISHTENILHLDKLPEGVIIDCTASRRCLYWTVSSGIILEPILRTEIYMDGKLGVSFLEGKERNPDVFDMQVCLYNRALDEDIIFEWLTYEPVENMEYHIGIGCNSDTMVLDDAVISNHASIVPHLLRGYMNQECGVVCLNIFDKNNLADNKANIIEIGNMAIFENVDGWSIHIYNSLVQEIQIIARDKTESAGLWIGHIDNILRRVSIVNMYIPEDCIREEYHVSMGCEGVEEFLEMLDLRTGGMLQYVGEWHTHTCGDATPSSIDQKAFDETKPNTDVFVMSIATSSQMKNYIINRRN